MRLSTNRPRIAMRQIKTKLVAELQVECRRLKPLPSRQRIAARRASPLRRRMRGLTYGPTLDPGRTQAKRGRGGLPMTW